VAAIESYYLRVKGLNYSLSEQQIVSCDTQMYGCYGGDNYQALNFVINTGINFQSVYPYSTDALYYGTTDRCNQALSSGPVKIKTVPAINPYANCNYNPNTVANFTNNIYQAILLQPLGISVDAQTWSQYASGIFSASGCGTTIDHDVFLVGRVPGQYLKIKNSWGTYWGEKGFIRLQDVANVCGTSQCPLPYVSA
jgi:hypothetical protein